MSDIILLCVYTVTCTILYIIINIILLLVSALLLHVKRMIRDFCPNS